MGQQQSFPVVVVKLKKDDQGRKVEDGVMPDYNPKVIRAVNAEQAREVVLVELIKAGDNTEGGMPVYDPADPMLRIEVCTPFAPVASSRY